MNSTCICLAHRGASGYEPENTLRSFAKAVELGARWVEFDVRVVEGQAIIFHDRTLNRMANCAGVVEKQTTDRIRSLTLPKGEKIPFLTEILTYLQGKASAQIELKGPSSGIVTAECVLQAITQGWLPSSFIVSSFDQDELIAFKKRAPAIPLGLLTYGYPLNCVQIAKKMGVFSVHLHIDSVTERRIQELHAAGLRVFVYTVNDLADIQLMKNMGVDGIFSDFPDRVISSLR